MITKNQLPLHAKSKYTIVSPIDANQLAAYLQGYDPTLSKFLVEGFKFGFEIPFQGTRQFRFSENLSSLKGNEFVLWQTINKELELGRVAGPFASIPFPNLQVSPLGLVPKHNPGEFRLIHHLSYPEGLSINAHIPRDLCTVQYQTIDTAIAAIKNIGVGALLAKTDLESAYKQVPVHPSDFELLGFSIDGQFYFDKTLPFGLSYSCNLFEKFSSALQWILQNKFSVVHCVHMLDDFLFIGNPDSLECHNALMAFHSLADNIHLPIKHAKTVFPCTTLTFLGLEIDTIKFKIRLPQDKLFRLADTIQLFKNKRTTTLRELQSLIGVLNFSCSVVPPGRTFLRRIIDLTKGLKKPFHHRRLNAEARADLEAWSIFIEHFNGKALFHSGKLCSSQTLHLFTDASNLGFGCTFDRQWFYGPFETDWLKYHISVREFFPIVLAMEIWGESLSNTAVVLHSDNSAVVHVINKNSSKDPHLMKLMRRLMLASLKYNIHFFAEHIPGLYNVAPDLLSRLQIQRFRELFPAMKAEKTSVPQALLHI